SGSRRCSCRCSGSSGSFSTSPWAASRATSSASSSASAWRSSAISLSRPVSRPPPTRPNSRPDLAFRAERAFRQVEQGVRPQLVAGDAQQLVTGRIAVDHDVELPAVEADEQALVARFEAADRLVGVDPPGPPVRLAAAQAADPFVRLFAVGLLGVENLESAHGRPPRAGEAPPLDQREI